MNQALHGGQILKPTTYQQMTQPTGAAATGRYGFGLQIDRLRGHPYPSAKPVALSVEQLKAFERVYGIEGKGSRTLRVIDGVLTSTGNGSRPIKLTPVGPDRFQFDGGLAQAQIERGPKGSVMAFYAEGDGEAERWPRTGDVAVKQSVSLSPAEQAALVGDYASPQISIKVFLDAQGQLMGQVPGHDRDAAPLIHH